MEVEGDIDVDVGEAGASGVCEGAGEVGGDGDALEGGEWAAGDEGAEFAQPGSLLGDGAEGATLGPAFPHGLPAFVGAGGPRVGREVVWLGEVPGGGCPNVAWRLLALAKEDEAGPADRLAGGDGFGVDDADAGSFAADGGLDGDGSEVWEAPEVDGHAGDAEVGFGVAPLDFGSEEAGDDAAVEGVWVPRAAADGLGDEGFAFGEEEGIGAHGWVMMTGRGGWCQCFSGART